MHQAAMERLCRGEAGREAVALEELHEARKGRDAARKRVEAAEALLREWLLAEGAKRVYASAQGKERRRLRRETASLARCDFQSSSPKLSNETRDSVQIG